MDSRDAKIFPIDMPVWSGNTLPHRRDWFGLLQRGTAVRRTGVTQSSLGGVERPAADAKSCQCQSYPYAAGHGAPRRDTVHRPNPFLSYQNLDHRDYFIACDRFPKATIRTYFDEMCSGQSLSGLIRSSYISGWYMTGRYPRTRVQEKVASGQVNHQCRRGDVRPSQTPASR